jgi:predicted dienelactone hydrolase
MKFLLSLLVAAAILIPPPAEAADAVGVRTLSVPAPERGADLAVTIWYPAAAGGERVLVGDDRLFKGEPAWRDAPVAPGRFPLILVSHGSGSQIETLGWLAAPLAAAGFIVAGPNHPGTTRGNSTPAETATNWQRPPDLSAVLTALSADPAWQPHLDPQRVGAIGFSLGGHTALAIAGARAEREAYARYCDANRSMADCVWFASGRVDLRQVDKGRFEQSSLDPRIRSVVAVDPSVAQALTPDSLRAIGIPVHLINLGRPGTIPVSVQSDRIAGMIPQGDYATVDQATHLSFLAECQPGGPAFLQSLGETDRLCDEAGGRSRAEIHVQLVAMIEAAFLRDLHR